MFHDLSRDQLQDASPPRAMNHLEFIRGKRPSARRSDPRKPDILELSTLTAVYLQVFLYTHRLLNTFKQG